MRIHNLNGEVARCSASHLGHEAALFHVKAVQDFHRHRVSEWLGRLCRQSLPPTYHFILSTQRKLPTRRRSRPQSSRFLSSEWRFQRRSKACGAVQDFILRSSVLQYLVIHCRSFRSNTLMACSSIMRGSVRGCGSAPVTGLARLDERMRRCAAAVRVNGSGV